MFEVTLLGVLASGILALVVGMIWFHPKVFGGVWMKMAGITPEMMEAGKKRMPVVMIVAFIAALIMAFILNNFGIAWGVFDLRGALEVAFWSWLGFVAPPMLGSVLWEMKPVQYYVIAAGYWLVAMLLMAITLLTLSA